MDGNSSSISPPSTSSGVTLLELLVVIVIVAIMTVLAVPLFNSYYGSLTVRTAIWEIAAIIREARQRSLDVTTHAVSFDPVICKISLVSDAGADGIWNTPDDHVIRSIRLHSFGGGLSFGHGTRGPVPGMASTSDGITFQTNNSLICNEKLTGNAGSVYVQSVHGPAMVLTINSTDVGYTVRKWSCGRWVAF